MPSSTDPVRYNAFILQPFRLWLAENRHADSEGIISRQKKRARLCLVTTTSALGRSSLYNRLALNGVSAPHQRFVLPVRVRDFEKLYRRHVKSDPNEPARGDTQANEIVRTVGEAQHRLADKLKQQLLGPKVEFVRVPNALPGGAEGIGVASGQLAYASTYWQMEEG